mmetsp:Transcript_24368/g.67743  ORF Transcript_24368/g.67743 Transcript_24368/m.67743 type:complete len:242 (+) Transcript_24368:502-1227(+)
MLPATGVQRPSLHATAERADGVALHMGVRHFEDTALQEVVLDTEGFQVRNEGARVEGRGAGVHSGSGKAPHAGGRAAALQLLEAVQQREGVLPATEAQEEPVPWFDHLPLNDGLGDEAHQLLRRLGPARRRQALISLSQRAHGLDVWRTERRCGLACAPQRVLAAGGPRRPVATPVIVVLPLKGGNCGRSTDGGLWEPLPWLLQGIAPLVAAAGSASCAACAGWAFNRASPSGLLAREAPA